MFAQLYKTNSFVIVHDSERVNLFEPQCENRGRVWINATQYFDGVSKEVWEFHVGGYRICAKWFKNRKGRVASSSGTI